MPRMHVNLRPSTVQFDDGEDPIVSGVARFGDTMAKLPLQMAQLRMQQQEQADHRNEFAAAHQLRMNADQREQDVHPYDVATKRGGAIKSGAYLPEPANEQMMTADEQNDQLLRAHGEEKRQAEMNHLNGVTGGSGKPHWNAFGDKLNGIYMYNQNDPNGAGHYVEEPAGTPAPAKPTAPPDNSHWYDGAMNWLDERIRTEPAPAHSPLPGPGPGGTGDPADAALHDAMAQHDAGNPRPLRDLMIANPEISKRVRAMAQQQQQPQPASAQMPSMSP